MITLPTPCVTEVFFPSRYCIHFDLVCVCASRTLPHTHTHTPLTFASMELNCVQRVTSARRVFSVPLPHVLAASIQKKWAFSNLDPGAPGFRLEAKSWWSRQYLDSFQMRNALQLELKWYRTCRCLHVSSSEQKDVSAEQARGAAVGCVLLSAHVVWNRCWNPEGEALGGGMFEFLYISWMQQTHAETWLQCVLLPLCFYFETSNKIHIVISVFGKKSKIKVKVALRTGLRAVNPILKTISEITVFESFSGRKFKLFMGKKNQWNWVKSSLKQFLNGMEFRMLYDDRIAKQPQWF